MPAIIDNQSKTLAGELKVALGQSGTRLDSSVGYFNLRGWGKLADLLETLPGCSGTPGTPAVRLLIGMSSSPHNRLQAMLAAGQLSENHQVEFSVQNKLLKAEKQNMASQLTWGIPTQDDTNALQKLNNLLKQGKVQVRFYGHYPLHAKLYLCHRSIAKSEIIAYTGSSNMTLAGLEGQGELNVEISDIDMTHKLQKWFEKRWDEAADYEITEFILETIEQSWAGETQPDPYLVHLKLAYHLSQDARDGLAEYALPEVLQDKLLEFQAQAVKIAARNMMTRGGAMIGDVVGLGKTLMATGAARILQEMHNYETLVICPKNLMEMWGAYMHDYELRGKVISIGETLNHLNSAPRYRTVIIDESHNFRTRGRRRWTAVRDYIARNEPKVLLLTATPFNLKMSDLGGQLGLFISDDETLEVVPNNAIARMGQAEFLRRCDDRPYSLKAFELSDYSQDWQRLLSNYMIRRTRSFIEKNYALADEDSSGKATGKRYFKFSGDDRKHYLPTRQPEPTPVELLAGDPTGAMQADQTIDEIESLNLPRFGWSKYVSEDLTAIANSEEQTVLKNSLANGRSLRGLTRSSLYKRMSSSSIAFELSVQRHLIKNIVVKLCLEDDQPIPTSNYEFELDPDTGEADQLALDDDLDDDDVDSASTLGEAAWWKLSKDDIYHKAKQIIRGLSANKRVKYLSPGLFQNPKLVAGKEDLLSHLNHDIKILEGMLERFDPVHPATDSKFQKILEITNQRHPDEKFIIFTEYADTANYLGRALAERNIAGGVGQVTGSSENPLATAKRFSPKSNNAVVEPVDELRVLVSTDVLSEGMNLQDARIIINYDLPWAIIKLIQRAGRVDRIGQEADEVIIYSVLPFEGVNQVIKLQERLQERLRQAAEVVGSDEIIFGHQGETSAYREFLEEGKLPDQEEFGVDYASQAFEIWDSASAEHQKAARELSEPAVSTLGSATSPNAVSVESEAADTAITDTARPNTAEGVLSFTKVSYDKGSVNLIAFASADETARSVSPQEALQLTSCSPSTPPASPHPDFYKLLDTAASFSEDLTAQPEEGKIAPGIRHRTRERLKQCLDATETSLFVELDQIHRAFDLLGKFPLQENAKQNLAKAMRDSDPNTLLSLVVHLLEANSLVIDTQNEIGDSQLICAMGVVNPS